MVVYLSFYNELCFKNVCLYAVVCYISVIYKEFVARLPEDGVNDAEICRNIKRLYFFGVKCAFVCVVNK